MVGRKGEILKKALITGVTGQDGSYLAELLLDKGYEVHGLIRRSSSFNTARISHIFQEADDPQARFFLHYADLEDSSRLASLIIKLQPDEIYNLAAQSHVRVSFDIPEYTGDVSGLGVVRILEAIRDAEVNCKFYQASSSELYGSTPPPQNEETAFHPRSPYASAKLFAYWTTVNYREAYGIHASNGILFNHESPRRGETFVTRKITLAAAKIALGQQDHITLGNVDAVRDWGFAKEYVEAMWAMLQRDSAEDFVIATGVAATVRQFAEAAFDAVGLDFDKYLRIDQKYFRPTEVDALIGDPTKATNELGWKHSTDWRGLAKLMVEADFESLRTGKN